MKLYSITDGYIDYLRREHPHVYSNKEVERVNSRKYVGTVLTVGDFDYFIPLSSPKPRDYETDKEGRQVIRKDSYTIFRIVEDGELRGTLQFSNMIPVPEGELLDYNPATEPDEKYKMLVLKELEYIRKNESRITSRARSIHYQKCNGYDAPVLKHCLDYAAIEIMCREWVKLISE